MPQLHKKNNNNNNNNNIFKLFLISSTYIIYLFLDICLTPKNARRFHQQQKILCNLFCSSTNHLKFFTLQVLRHFLFCFFLKIKKQFSVSSKWWTSLYGPCDFCTLTIHILCRWHKSTTKGDENLVFSILSHIIYSSQTHNHTSFFTPSASTEWYIKYLHASLIYTILFNFSYCIYEEGKMLRDYLPSSFSMSECHLPKYKKSFSTQPLSLFSILDNNCTMKNS